MKVDSFTSSFLVWMPNTSFSCLTALATTSSTMFKSSDDIFVLFLILGGDCSLSSLNRMLAVGFS